MMNKKILFISIFIFMIVLSIGAVSAEDADDAIASGDDDIALGDSEPTASGSVSGGVDVKTENPWTATGGQPGHGELSYDIPADAKTIKSADVYVNVYGTTATDAYATNVTTTIKTDNGDESYNEILCIASDKSSTVYSVNDHVTKSYLDYMIHYDITGKLTGLNGTTLKIDVDTNNMTGLTGKSFDGRIKLIALVLAYDDGDDDVINYWINDNQIWTDSNATLTFDTTSMNDVLEMSLTNIVLSSSDATYKINDKFLSDAEHVSGGYYQYNKWDVTKYFNNTKKMEFLAIGAPGLYGGVSHKNALSVLIAVPGSIEASVSLKAKGNAKNIIYPGINNTLTVTVNTNQSGTYTINLYDGDTLVNSTEVSLSAGSQSIELVDTTFRPLTESSEYIGTSGSYDKVNYNVQLLYHGKLVNETAYAATLLYNGYLAKDTYNKPSFEPFYTGIVSGDMVILTNGSYVGGSVNNVDANFAVDLDENSTIVKAFLYVTYCYASGGKDNIDMYNVTFNGVKLTPMYFARDQNNLESNSGYGVVVYEVTDSIISGNNVLDLNKTVSAVYPSTLIYMYNTTGSQFVKEIYILNGHDLLGTYGGIDAPIIVNSEIDVDSSDVIDATAYIFANGAKDGRGTVVINGESYEHPWNGGSSSTDLFSTDITGTVGDSNSISVIYSGRSEDGSFVALQQIIKLTKERVQGDVSVKVRDYSKNIVYPEFKNTLSVTINSNRVGNYTINLFDGTTLVNSTVVSLTTSGQKFDVVDPTNRPLSESSMYVGAGTYDTVNYTVQVLFNNDFVNESGCVATVLYNGYLGKDTYNDEYLEPFYTGTISGDIAILINGSYVGGSVNNVAANFTVDLAKDSQIVKAFLYVTYCYASGGKDNIDMYNVTFNGIKLTPMYFARDQSNLESNSGYGVVVYEVTDSIKTGNNALDLNKTVSAVYPSTLIYMYNTTGSQFVKEIYISNGIDLLGSSGGLSNPIAANSVINVDSSNVVDATAYIFANGATDGKCTVVINDVSDEHPWNGNSYSTDLLTKNITGTVKDSNSISVVLSGTGTVSALQQIIVLTKAVKEDVKPAPTPDPTPGKDTPAQDTSKKATKKATKITAKKATFKAKKKVKKYTITLKAGKKPVKKVKVTLKIGKKTYKAKTNAKGKATFKITKLTKKGKYKAVIKFAGNSAYKSAIKRVKITVKK